MTNPKPLRMTWTGAFGFPKPISAHVEQKGDDRYVWTATDRYGMTETGTEPDEHTARLAAEEHALRERPGPGHQLGPGREVAR
jgi:hypothetical protein